MDTTPTPPRPADPVGPASRRGLVPLVALLMALIGLAVAGPSRSAFGSEFEPEPHATTTAECSKAKPSQYVVTAHLSNTGLDFAHFEINATYDGSLPATGNYSLGPGDTNDIKYFYDEGKPGTLRIRSSDDPSLDVMVDIPPVDCSSDPTAAIAVVCPAGGGKAQVVYSYANPSAVAAGFLFHFPDGSATSINVANQPQTKTISKEVDEDTTIDGSIWVDGVKLASVVDQKVDCLPDTHVVTVTKHVIGPGSTFPFELRCGVGSPDTVVKTFELGNGESEMTEVPEGRTCEVEETLDPTAPYLTHFTVDGGNPTFARTTGQFSSNDDHDVSFTNEVILVPLYELTLRKTVTGKVTDSVFELAITCTHPNGPDTTDLRYLGDGDEITYEMDGTIDCTVTETDPGSGYTTTVAVDGGAATPAMSATVDNDDDHTVAFVNHWTQPTTTTTTTTTTTSTTTSTTTTSTTLPTTTSTTTTSTTLPTTTSTTTTSTTLPTTTTTAPDPTVPETVPDPTVPGPTVPGPTVPATLPDPADPGPTTTEGPTSSTSTTGAGVEGTSISIDPAPPARTGGLARTGADTLALAALGAMVLAAGLLLVLATRRSAEG